ncbi:MAG: AraC family transcriptional regulator [Bacteroidetes bacterium 43-93]|nr:helix-turn-helix transcriptional regulator [Bacteroidota bacterium]OJW99132.1 MAG: AraC family transcriptional regulator [Bacteroidetes bacterium 43-93]
MKIYIKNMVCDRCVMVVRSELEKMGLQPVSVELGQVELAEDITEETKGSLGEVLEQLGFEIIDDKRSRIIEKIKSLIIQSVQKEAPERKINLSDYLSQQLHYDYNYLSTLFSEIEGVTIEKFLIKQKIEKAKELLVYDELSLSQIADYLGYSSVAHLSSQFKQVTGFTPSHFKTIREKRKPIDKV